MSKTQLKNIHYSINEFCKKHKDQMSFETKNSMSKRLKTIFQDLHGLGYKVPKVRNIKAKHIKVLVDHWQSKGLSAGTIKNRMSNLRYICKAYNRTNVVDTNNSYGIEKRSYIPTQNKAIQNLDVSKITDTHLRASLVLQEQFGLRREECLKIKPEQALQTNSSGSKSLKLQPSWTKGGVGRSILIRTPEQLKAVTEAIKLVGKGSMIPSEQSYIERRNQYDNQTQKAGLKNLHGLRHAYAQNRYKELTDTLTKGNGWVCPLEGGPKRYQLTAAQKQVDKLAKLKISNEMGHSRIAIIKNYIG